jgi:hypothetical protein
MLLFNIGISCSLLLKYNYGGYKMITNLITNFSICVYKINTGLHVSTESLRKGIGYSYFNIQQLSFNRIDPKIKKHTSHSSDMISHNCSCNNSPSGGSLNASINAGHGTSTGTISYPSINTFMMETFLDTLDTQNIEITPDINTATATSI